MEYRDFFDEMQSNRTFNTTGICNEKKHYMVNIDSKLKKIVKLVQEEKYFVINRPRQYGKTTTLNKLDKILRSRYIVIKMNFEGMDSEFENEERFCNRLIEEFENELKTELEKVDSIYLLSKLIQKITENKELILIIDEVDRASNNELFLEFLGMLRALYLAREMDEKPTFKAVILAGVHDIKNLKLKFREEKEIRYNSPWNIAADFNIDMSFNEKEIESMLVDYAKENKLNLNTEKLSKEIYKFTSGYPFLVSRICKIIDEDILIDKNTLWEEKHIQRAIKIMLEENNTLFDDLIKNIQNHKELREYLYNILVCNIPSIFNIDNPVINLGFMYGYLDKDKENNVIISNKIIKERIYNYLISRAEIKDMSSYNFKSNFITKDNGLDMEKILLKFQQFMKENYSTRNIEFLERHGVLLFLSFIKPIINGVGFDYKEVQISEERRLDIVISYNNYKYIIETKIWHGESAHKKGLIQLHDYLDIEGIKKGYLLIFNFNKNKIYNKLIYKVKEKEIFEVNV